MMKVLTPQLKVIINNTEVSDWLVVRLTGGIF